MNHNRPMGNQGLEVTEDIDPKPRSAIVRCLGGVKCWATKMPGAEWLDFFLQEVKVLEVIKEL